MRRHRDIEVPQTLDEVCRPERMALVVYDMQVGIVRQVPQGPAIVTRCAAVLDAARRGGFRVVFMRHMSMPKPLMGAFQMRQAMAWQRAAEPEAVEPWFLRGTPGFEIVPELAPTADEAVLDKITFSAFEGTPLATVLRDCGLQAFAVMGLAMEIGIDPTVRHGADLGLIPVVVEDACGHGHGDAARRSMENIAFMGDALVTDVAGITELMRRFGP